MSRAEAPESVRAAVAAYVLRHLLDGHRDGFRDGDSFLDRGLIDSTGVLELVGFLQDRFRIRVDDDELVPDNLDSIDRVCAYVDRKLGDARP